MITEFKKCSRAIVREMIESFFEQTIDIPEDDTLDYKWTPAEVNQILFRNFGRVDTAIQDLLETRENGFVSDST
jgi:hypothetical protein